MPMDIRKIKKLIELLESSAVAEIEIKEGEDSVRISRHPQNGASVMMPWQPPLWAAPAAYGFPPTAPVMPVPAPPTATPATRKALTILVVDDDLLVLVSTCAMIEQLGHKVVEAASGREALAYVANGGPLDMVVTDHAMPQMSGMQLAEAIRALKPEMPVLLVSGYAELPPGTL